MKKSACVACLVAVCVSELSAPLVMAQSSGKQMPARSIDVKKVFAFYDVYLGLPPRDRDGFTMSYRLNVRNGGPVPQLSYLLGTVRTPIQIAPTGKIVTMPDMNMFRNGKIEIAAGEPSGAINLNLDAIVPLSRSISIADARNPLDDYSAAVRRAGPLALLAPKLTKIKFTGVTTGEAVFADGRRVALTPSAGGVVFAPSLPTMRGAASLVFPTQPAAANFAQ